MRILSIHGGRAVAGETRFPSTAADIWKSARGRAGTLRAAAVVRADAMAGTTADHETATLLLLDVGTVGAANRILFWNCVLGATARISTKPHKEFSPGLRSRG